jgi:hypothetical protein
MVETSFKELLHLFTAVLSENSAERIYITTEKTKKTIS